LPEFRWILLGLGLLLIAGIWWWGGRRSTQAPGNAALRETTAKETPRQEAAALGGRRDPGALIADAAARLGRWQDPYDQSRVSDRSRRPQFQRQQDSQSQSLLSTLPYVA